MATATKSEGAVKQIVVHKAREKKKEQGAPTAKRAKGVTERPIGWVYEFISADKPVKVETIQAEFEKRRYSDATRHAQLHRIKRCGDFVLADEESTVRLKKSVAEERERAAAAKEKEKEKAAKEEKAMAKAEAKAENKIAAKA